MSESAATYWLHALTPVRIGVEAGLGAINLPTMREAHTQHPLVPGSSLKGVLRADLADEVTARKLFGPDREHASDHRGPLSITDAILVALPVRSLYGTFAWCCSPLTLGRLRRARVPLGLWPEDRLDPRLSDPTNDGVRVTEGSVLLRNGEMFVEEFTATATEDSALTHLAKTIASEVWPEDPVAREFFQSRLALLPNEVLDALTLNGLEVRARVALDPDKGTAASSGPWLEEAMPAETLLSGLIVGRTTKIFRGATGDERQDEEMLSGSEALRRWRDLAPVRPIYVGGHTSVGYGRVQLRVAGLRGAQ